MQPIGRFLVALVTGFGCATTTSCSLTPAPPPAIRWFTVPVAEAGPALSGAESAPRPALRLRRVTAARHLGERMAWREGVEYGYRELERWTELPDALVGRALERALFEAGPFQRDGRAELALDVEVRAFEELRGPRPVARVELGLVLAAGGERAAVDRTVRADAPLADLEGGARPRDVAEAMGAAVEAAIATTLAALREAAAAQPAPSGP